MILSEIYEQYSVGSTGFVEAVQTHCGFQCSDTELERIAQMSPTAEEFQDNWHELSNRYPTPCNQEKKMSKLLSSNLRILADFIEANVPQSGLEMNYYHGAETDTDWLEENNCGTVGCALGWAVRVPELVTQLEGLQWLDDGDIRFHEVQARLFPDDEIDRDARSRSRLRMEHTKTYNQCFQGQLNSDKALIIKRLRDRASQVENA